MSTSFDDRHAALLQVGLDLGLELEDLLRGRLAGLVALLDQRRWYSGGSASNHFALTTSKLISMMCLVSLANFSTS